MHASRIILFATMATLAAGCAHAPVDEGEPVFGEPERPERPGVINVAFVVTGRFNLLDLAGAWEVFNSARRPKPGARWEEGDRIFRLYLVSNARQEIHADGVSVLPEYTFGDAPRPELIVIGAQTGNPSEMFDWLARQAKAGATLLSVSMGVEKLARLGLLDDRPATTHHDYLAAYQKEFPKVRWIKDRRYVRSSDNVFTSAGGGLSGLDLALHVIDSRMGRIIAQGTADYLEHRGEDWKENSRVEGF
jgi:transcriptional regulator GlxA family with amidase domain